MKKKRNYNFLMLLIIPGIGLALTLNEDLFSFSDKWYFSQWFRAGAAITCMLIAVMTLLSIVCDGPKAKK